MKKSFRFAAGIVIPRPEGIHEAYSVKWRDAGHYVFTVNVSTERIPEVFAALVAQIPEPGYLLLEVGTHKDEENKLRRKDTDPYHKDVHYLDGIGKKEALAVFREYESLLVNDGGVNFGFGSHGKMDEVFVGPYKILYVYAAEKESFETALTDLGFSEEPIVRTVWDTFTPSSPGQRQVLTDAPVTIWDMIEKLKEKGLRFAERRED